MTHLQSELVKIINFASPGEGKFETPVPGAYCIKFLQPGPRYKKHWQPSLGIVVQGGKEIGLDREVYRFDDAHYIMLPIDLPVISRIVRASREKPFLALLIVLDPLVLGEVSRWFGKEIPKGAVNRQRAIFAGKASDKMLEATVRLGNLFKTPSDARVLGPLVVKEILYHLLKEGDGPAIRQFARLGSTVHKISQAILAVRSGLSEDVDVAALAREAGMSRSAFFAHFKEVTAMSPIQYQKRLRLLEARRLMAEEGDNAEGSAYKVGYKSASQFSREYSRMFGNAPLRDVIKIKDTGVAIDQF